jgi:hypothetical protein
MTFKILQSNPFEKAKMHMTTTKTLDQFLNMAKARNITLRPYVLNGTPSLVADGPEMDPAFRHEFERFRHTAAALLWEQAQKITRDLKAKADACGARLHLVPYNDGRPGLCATGGDQEFSKLFEKHHLEVAAVMRAEAS